MYTITLTPTLADLDPPVISLRTIRRDFSGCDGSSKTLQATVYDEESGLRRVVTFREDQVRHHVVPRFGGYTFTVATAMPGESIAWRIIAEDFAGNTSTRSGVLRSPPPPPGCDHPDDNASAADAPIPSGQFLAAPAGARMPPRAAILNRGAAHGLWWLLMQGGNPKPQCPNPNVLASITIVTPRADGVPVCSYVICHWSLVI